jgi:hypothetical protein
MRQPKPHRFQRVRATRSTFIFVKGESSSRETLLTAGGELPGTADRAAWCELYNKGKLIMTVVAPDGPTGEQSRMCGSTTERRGNSEFKKGVNLMNTTMKSKRHSPALLLSILCAGVVATFLGGCAEGPYMTAYDTGYTYPTTYYTPYSSGYYYGYPASYYYGDTPMYQRTYVNYGRSYNSYDYGY